MIDNSQEETELNRRRAAVVAAGHVGDHRLALEAIDDPEPEVRSSALGALARMNALGDEILDRALKDPSPRVRTRAARLSAQSRGFSDGLLGLLGDSDDTVVEVTAFALGECEEVPRSAIVALCDIAARHNDSLCRESAVAALGSIGSEEGLPAILAACSDKATVRRRAVLALAPFEGAVVSEMLRSMSSDRDLQVRQAAAELLAIEAGENT